MTTAPGAPDTGHDSAAPPCGNPAAERSPDNAGNAAGSRHPIAARPPLWLVQGTLDGLGRPLAQTEFVVVDLETTGGSLADAGITELAAVRTSGGRADRAGAADREFATLVNPGRAIEPHVAMLTGITDALVAAAPRIEDVLPRFLRFATGAVLVAHNARFDIGFLSAACVAHNLSWPRLPTLDTAALARHLLTTDEVPDCRLGTLAEFFGAATMPNHRALDDARATTAVLHGLIGRLAGRGVHTLEALGGLTKAGMPEQRRMRQLTARIPRKPGVCLFTAVDGQVLLVVRSSDMHARACGYFTAAQARREIREMVDKTTRILPVRCATALEAEVAEIRLIAAHRPPYGTGRPAAGHAGHRGGATSAADGDSTLEAARSAALSALADVPLLVAARPRFCGGWDVAWIRYGWLAQTAVLARGAGPPAGVRDAGPAASCPVPAEPPASSGATAPGDGPLPPALDAAAAQNMAAQNMAARYAETACLLGWLESPGVRLMAVEGTWCSAVPR